MEKKSRGNKRKEVQREEEGDGRRRGKIWDVRRTEKQDDSDRDSRRETQYGG